MVSLSLEFDKMTVDTSLANEYLKKNLLLSLDIDNYQLIKTDEVNIEDKLVTLVELVEKNKQLFCQIEYELRGIPIKQTEEFDLKLLINNLKYSKYYQTKDKTIKQEEKIISLGYNSPLVTLDCVVQVFLGNWKSVVFTATKMLPVIKLFLDLCVEAGSTSLRVNENIQVGTSMPKLQVSSRCTAIITRKSDIESAVDVFLHSTLTYDSNLTYNPWSLQNIYIEESAIQRFIDAISWKCTEDASLYEISLYCTKAYHFEGKLFLYQYVGDGFIKNAIHIHSYRTVKDLLNMLRDDKTPVASLWCNDVSECYEITTNIKKHFVWVNDYLNANISPKASQAFSSCYYETPLPFKITRNIQDLGEIQSKWIKNDICVRKKIVSDALSRDIGLDFCFDFVENTRDYTCIGTFLPCQFVYGLQDTTSIIRAVIHGSAVICNPGNKGTEQLSEKLRKIGAPVMITDVAYAPGECNNCVRMNTYWPAMKPYFIWTSFGTIFAN